MNQWIEFKRNNQLYRCKLTAPSAGVEVPLFRGTMLIEENCAGVWVPMYNAFSDVVDAAENAVTK